MSLAYGWWRLWIQWRLLIVWTVTGLWGTKEMIHSEYWFKSTPAMKTVSQPFIIIFIRGVHCCCVWLNPNWILNILHVCTGYPFMGWFPSTRDDLWKRYVSLGKHGVGVDGCLDLVEYIREECEHLHFAGLRTIGRMNHQHQIHGPNPDFTVCATSLYSKEDLKWECPHQLEGYAWSYLCKRFIFPPIPPSSINFHLLANS